jgi:hypothetical protein
MSTPLTTNHYTWGPTHSDNPDRGSQRAEHESVSPGESPSPPSYSGYAYVSAPLRPFQPLSAYEGQGHQENSNNNGNLIQPTFSSLPPTPAGKELDNPYHCYYYTFPPHLNSLPLSPTLTNPTPEATTTNKANDQQSSCYFETLDFSDYLHPTANPSHRLLLADNNRNHHPYRPRNNNHSNSNTPIGRGAAAFPAHLRGKYPGSNGYNYDTFTANRGDGDDSNPPCGIDPGTSQGGFDLQRGWWRATRGAVVVVWVVVLLAGLLVVVGFGVARGGPGVWDGNGKGGGRFIKEVGGEEVAGDGWGLCTDARPRFCRLVVGAGVGR